jgi:UDP-glucuronate 4-epimerase
MDVVPMAVRHVNTSAERILVTGGAGFIGSHLVDRLLKDGKHVVCLDNFDSFYDPEIKRRNISSYLQSSAFRLVEGDIRNMEDLEAVFREGGINKVVHLAARAGVRPSIQNPHLYEEVNVRGTLNLLELARIYHVENLVFASSSSVYGINAKVPFSEADDVSVPISPYAATKRAGELLCYTYHHLYDLPVTCLRFFTVYGPRQRPEMAIHMFTRLVDQGAEIPMFGDGTSRRDYTYISDIIDGVMAAVDRTSGYEIINLGNSKTVELRRLVSLIETNLGKTAIVRRLSPQPGDVHITFADVSKAQRLLGYDPKVDIEMGIKSFVRWYKSEQIRD